jgi:hypothetical protein
MHNFFYKNFFALYLTWKREWVQMINDRERGKDIGRLALVLGSAVAFAFVISMALLWSSQTSSMYLAGDCLIKPDLLKEVQMARREGGGKPHLYEVASIQYAYYSTQARSFVFADVSYEAYSRFYEKVKALRSIPEEEVDERFFSSRYSSLHFYLREKMALQERQLIDFLQVQFASELNLFRVELRESGQKPRWAYFQKEDLSSILSFLRK